MRVRYNKIIGDQITIDKGYPKEVPVYMIIVVFIVVFAYILFAILYVIQMKLKAFFFYLKTLFNDILHIKI